METVLSKPRLSKRILEMKESSTLKMAALSRALKAEGHNVISLSLGEPDFDTPEHIKVAAKQAIDDNFSHYTPVPGYLDLREAISHKFKRDNKVDYSPAQIVVSTGAKQTLANLMLCLLNEGDEVILPIPYWVSYEAQVILAGATVNSIPTSVDTDFKITAAQLEEAINENTKVFLFSSPCNPSGSVYLKEELEALADVLAKHPQIVVVADEIYEHINFTDGHFSIAQLPQLKDRVVTVNGLSKGFAMTGWRLGYMGAPLDIAKACSKMQGQFTSATCSITQRAAIVALGDNLEPTFKMKEAFKQRRALMIELLSDMPGVKINEPEGAFYIFPDFSAFVGKKAGDTVIESVDQLCMHILNTAHVALVAGAGFGNPECMRISYANSEENLREAMARMKKCLSELS